MKIHKSPIVFFAFSPLALALSRSIQPEVTLLFASLGALYLFYRYAETGLHRHFYLSAIFMFLAIATKFTVAFLFIPMAWLVWRKDGFFSLFKLRYLFYVFLACLPLAWYYGMWSIAQEQELAYTPYMYVAHRAGALRRALLAGSLEWQRLVRARC